MSKNIYITEGRKGRRFGSVEKLKTELQGGGSCLWVPEDDVQLDPLFATENGVYIPDEYGFSDASVNVIDGNLGSLDADDNLPYFPDDDLDGYSKVDVNVPNERQNTFTDAIQIETLGYRADLPYLITVFYDYTDDAKPSHGLLSISVQCKYPPYVVTNSNGHSAVSLYGDGYDNFRMHISWRLNDSSGLEDIVPYCYLNPVTIFLRNLIDSSFTLHTGRITSGESGYGLYYAYEPIEDFPHVVDDSTIGQLVIEKYGGYNYCVILGGTVGRVLTKRSTWTTPTASEQRVVTSVKSRPDHTSYFYSSKIVYSDSRVIYGIPFASGQEWLAWCKAH